MLRRSDPLAAALVAVALCFTVVPPAAADGPVAYAAGPEAPAEDSEQLSAAAVEAFHAKDYDKAVELFERAYELDPQPNYKFNIGRVYEEKGDLAKAVQYYQEFVKSPGVDISARESASARLKVLREALKAVEEEKAEERAQEDDKDEAQVEPTVTPPFDDGVTERKRKLRIAGYSLLGVGGVGLIIGAVFGGLALGKSRDADDAGLVDDKVQLRQDAKVRANVADAMFITGGILAGTGLILVLSTLGKGGKREVARRSTFAPSFSHRSAGLSWTGRF